METGVCNDYLKRNDAVFSAKKSGLIIRIYKMVEKLTVF